MSATFHPGSRVKWQWGGHPAEGVIQKVYTDRVERTIRGAHVKSNADRQNPAYLIQQDDGARVLKSHSELTHI